MLPLLYIVIPCCNVSAVLSYSVRFYEEKIEELVLCKKISALSRILLIDNGSRDETWNTITDLSNKKPIVSGIKLGRNFGLNNALICGFNEAQRYADIVIAADCLCKRDINAVDRMVEEYRKGKEIVFSARETSLCKLRRLFKKNNTYLKACADPEFFLVSKKVMTEVLKYSDCEIDLIKLFKDMNYKISRIYYKRRTTFNLHGKVTTEKFKEHFSLFFSSFSFPIHIMFTVGAVLSLYTSAHLIVLLFLNLLGAGLKTGSVILMFFISLQLLFTGIVGEYVIKIIREIKKHPKYTVIDTTEFEKK